MHGKAVTASGFVFDVSSRDARVIVPSALFGAHGSFFII